MYVVEDKHVLEVGVQVAYVVVEIEVGGGCAT
jgi:hypothetical protein